MEQLTVAAVTGPAIHALIPELARLRLSVFRDFPYLYAGTFDEEAEYLSTYSQSPRSVLIVARDGDRVVGVSTAVPLVDEFAEIQQPFRDAGYPLDQIVYFGESVLEPAYRGRGLGHRFFDLREAHALSLPGCRWTTFCAVDRDPRDPRRPFYYRPLDPFWQRRGYAQHPELRTSLTWQEVDQPAPTVHSLTFWLREWNPSSSAQPREQA